MLSFNYGVSLEENHMFKGMSPATIYIHTFFFKTKYG